MTPAEFKEARIALGLTSQQWADMLGYGAKTRISEIENGKLTPSKSVVLLAKFYLAIPPDKWPPTDP